MSEPTKEQMEAAAASIVQAPKFYGSMFHVNASSNEFSLLLSRPHFVMATEAAPGEPVAIIQMSPQAAKDLLLLLGGAMSDWEKEWGEVQTEYSRRTK